MVPVKRQWKKQPHVVHNTWGHHETMSINLRDWVRRELDALRIDLSRELPLLNKSTIMLKLLKSIEDTNAVLFNTISEVIEHAEVAAAKIKKNPIAVETPNPEISDAQDSASVDCPDFDS